MDSRDEKDLTVVYDAFADTATALSGHFVERADQAATPEEEQAWMDRVIRLRDEKREVNPHDREALLACMERWKRELDELRQD